MIFSLKYSKIASYDVIFWDGDILSPSYALLPYCRICAFAVFTVVKTDIFTVFINTKFCKQSYNTHTNQCSDNRNGYCYQYTKHLCHEQVIITENKTVPFSYRINRSLCKQACCDTAPYTADTVTSECVKCVIISEFRF